VAIAATALFALEIWKKQASEKTIEAGWKTFSDATKGVTFQYPESLAVKYIYLVDWPPQIQILNEPFACSEAGMEIARAGKTEKRIVGGRTYCVTKITEGTAGSDYTQYAYKFSGVFPKNNKVAILTFTLRFVRCENYDDSAQRECKSERKTFDVDSIIDRIARTSVFR
jgi:hypothetical protein